MWWRRNTSSIDYADYLRSMNIDGRDLRIKDAGVDLKKKHAYLVVPKGSVLPSDGTAVAFTGVPLPSIFTLKSAEKPVMLELIEGVHYKFDVTDSIVVSTGGFRTVMHMTEVVENQKKVLRPVFAIAYYATGDAVDPSIMPKGVFTTLQDIKFEWDLA